MIVDKQGRYDIRRVLIIGDRNEKDIVSAGCDGTIVTVMIMWHRVDAVMTTMRQSLPAVKFVEDMYDS